MKKINFFVLFLLLSITSSWGCQTLSDHQPNPQLEALKNKYHQLAVNAYDAGGVKGLAALAATTTPSFAWAVPRTTPVKWAMEDGEWVAVSVSPTELETYFVDSFVNQWAAKWRHSDCLSHHAPEKP